METKTITPKEFIDYECQHSRAAMNEWVYSINPEFVKYRINSSEFLSKEVYPTYRLDESGGKLTAVCEDKKATPITFTELSVRKELVGALLEEGYKSKNDTVIAYHCAKCCVWVIKDGIHRLITWTVNGENRIITVYQVSSCDWSRACVDMPNYCKCSNK